MPYNTKIGSKYVRIVSEAEAVQNRDKTEYDRLKASINDLYAMIGYMDAASPQDDETYRCLAALHLLTERIGENIFLEFIDAIAKLGVDINDLSYSMDFSTDDWSYYVQAQKAAEKGSK